MAEYVGSPQEFERIKRVCHSLVEIDKTLPDNVFCAHYDCYRFADFNGFFTSKGDVWDTILAFARKLDAGPLSLMVLDPAPESYCSWSGKYGAIVIDPKDQVGDIMEILSVSPDEAMRDSISGDGIMIVGDRFVVFSESSPDWCLWVDRYYGVAVIGLSDSPAWAEIEETWTETWLPVEDAIDQLIHLSFSPRHVPEDFRWALVANYGN